MVEHEPLTVAESRALVRRLIEQPWREGVSRLNDSPITQLTDIKVRLLLLVGH
jgi:hypothetical protein